MSCFFPWLNRSPVPAPPAVEREGAEPPPGSAPLSPGRADYFAKDQHEGSPDLDEYPASTLELHYASRVFHDPADHDSALILRSFARSAMRAAAIVRLVRRRAAADGICARIDVTGKGNR